jgi:hypothetical protein
LVFQAHNTRGLQLPLQAGEVIWRSFVIPADGEVEHHVQQLRIPAVMRSEDGERANSRPETAQGLRAVIDAAVVLDHVACYEDHVDRNLLQFLKKCEFGLVTPPEVQVRDMQNPDRSLQIPLNAHSGLNPSKAPGLDKYRIYEKDNRRRQDYRNDFRQIVRSPTLSL